MKLVAVIGRPYGGPPSRQFEGIPPMESGDPDTRQRLPVARVLLVSNRHDGVYLDRFDDSGAEAGDTWHESIEDAQGQAIEEYGESLGAWVEVPRGEQDPMAFAFRMAKSGELR